MEHQTYIKINSLYKRYSEGPLKNCIILGSYALSEFAYLRNAPWYCYEKIDGTNMSYYWDGHKMEIHGKGKNAQIPVPLKEQMEKMLTPEILTKVFPVTYNEEGIEKPLNVRIYGEGYGGNIQGKSGKGYKPNGEYSFIVFDININGYWLEPDTVDTIATRLGLQTCPLVGIFTLEEAESIVKKGFKSIIAENDNFMAEGLVCRTAIPLFNRSGDRIITKIKYKDYQKLSQKQR